MALEGDKNFLLGVHPEKITYDTGFQQPRSIADMQTQLGLLIDAVENYFRNECPRVSLDDLGNKTGKIGIAMIFTRAAELIKIHGSLVKLRELQNRENTQLDVLALPEAIKYLEKKGRGAENILSLRESIQREKIAKSDVVEGTVQQVLTIVSLPQE